MREGFIEVSKDEHTKFLIYLDEKEGYRYVPMPIADKTAVYHMNDTEHKTCIANRYMSWGDNSPEKYDVRKTHYNDFLNSL